MHFEFRKPIYKKSVLFFKKKKESEMRGLNKLLFNDNQEVLIIFLHKHRSAYVFSAFH